MNGKIFTAAAGSPQSVATGTHPPVFKTIQAVSAQGILPAGMLTAQDATGKVIPYNRGGSSPANVLKGVLARPIDTATDDAAVVIKHGTVASNLLVHGAASGAVTTADLLALEAIGIFAE